MSDKEDKITNEDIIGKLKTEIEKGKNEDLIKFYEIQLSKNILNVCEIEDFYSLSLTNIKNILEMIEYKKIDNYYSIIHDILIKVIQKYQNNPSILDLLRSIQCNQNTFTIDESITLLSLFPNVPLFSNLFTLYQDFLALPDIDFDYKLSIRDSEIKKLQDHIQSLENIVKTQPKNPNIKKPFFYESDIFKAIEKGKLTSVQYLIEHENVDVNLCNESNETLLDISQKYKQNDITNYLSQQGAQSKPHKRVKNDEITILLLCYSKSVSLTLIKALLNDYDISMPDFELDLYKYKIKINEKDIKLQIFITTSVVKYRALSK